MILLGLAWVSVSTTHRRYVTDRICKKKMQLETDTPTSGSVYISASF